MEKREINQRKHGLKKIQDQEVKIFWTEGGRT